MKHNQLTEIDFATAIKLTNTYNGFEKFKKGLTSRMQNIHRLYSYYQQACRYGIEYLQQNPNIFSNDVKMINDVINNN